MSPKLNMPVLDDFDDVADTMTWSVGANGTLRHRPTGLKVSNDTGIELDGKEYKLGPEDIELDRNQMLGHGAGGMVQLAIHKPTGQKLAIKTVKVDNKAKREQMLNEIRGLIQAEGCPYLVQWYAGFLSANSVHVALEFMDRGSLADFKKRMGGRGVPPRMLASVTRQMIQGLFHIHSRKLLHRDVKPENVLHNSLGEVKLTDFGISKDLDKTAAMAATFVGTAIYMSPERALGQDYSFVSDIWSVGMVVYELAMGCYPFPDVKSFPNLFQHLCEKPEPRLDPENFPEPLCNFVEVTLVRDVSVRWDTCHLLDHPYLQSDVATNEELAAFLATLPDS